tara:strand:+ start:1475 stop:2143 length:669 start_codon:yes stop_codon:yes gene_type:complete
MTKKQLRDRILDSLTESITNPKLMTLAQMDEVIEEGFEVLSEEVRSVKRQALIALRSGQSYYYTTAAAPDMMVPTRLTVMPDDWRLSPVSFRELNERHEEWQRVTGTTPQVWMSLSWNMFAIFPHLVTGNKLLRIDYIAWPRSYSDDDDSLEYQDSDQEAAVLYGVYRGLLQQWDFQAALQVYIQFIERFVDVKFKSDMKRASARMFQPSRTVASPFVSVSL